MEIKESNQAEVDEIFQKIFDLESRQRFLDEDHKKEIEALKEKLGKKDKK